MDELNTRSRIVNTAVNMIREHGYQNVSVTDICRELGITRSAFYYYFKKKDEIFDYFLMEPDIHISKDVVPHLENTAYLRQFEEIVKMFLDYINGLGPEILRIVLKRHADRGVEKITPRHAAQWNTYVMLIQKAQQSGELNCTRSAEEKVETVIYAINGVSLLWVHKNGGLCYQKECGKALRILFQGLVSSSDIR